MTSPRRVARRMGGIQPFRVMELLGRAKALEAQGRSIVHMEIGEPDFATPQPIVEAGIEALRAGHTHYTPAAGLPALREAVADYYRAQGVPSVSPERVLITPGASGALQLVLDVLIDTGDQVLSADPGYPCNRNFVHLVGGEHTAVPVDATMGYRVDGARLAAHWSERVAAVMLASPSNPTGTVLDGATLADIAALVRKHDAALIADEIYQGLVYDAQAPSALTVADEAFVINSFSKYFGMTGWRVGWLVAPGDMVPELEKLAQNIFLAAPTPAQHAALAAFDPGVQEILEQRRLQFQRRRDFLVPALRDLGFEVPVMPEGAFYIYAGCGRFTDDSLSFCQSLLDEAGVAVTPGLDFGDYQAATHVRFAYTTSMEQLEKGVRRLARFLGR